MGELVALLVVLLALLIDVALTEGEALVDAGRADEEIACEVTALADALALTEGEALVDTDRADEETSCAVTALADAFAVIRYFEN